MDKLSRDEAKYDKEDEEMEVDDLEDGDSLYLLYHVL